MTRAPTANKLPWMLLAALLDVGGGGEDTGEPGGGDGAMGEEPGEGGGAIGGEPADAGWEGWPTIHTVWLTALPEKGLQLGCALKSTDPAGHVLVYRGSQQGR